MLSVTSTTPLTFVSLRVRALRISKSWTSWNFMEATGVGPILAATNCRFKIPLTYPDTVSIGSRVSEIQSDRFTMEYYVVSHKHQRVAAEGTGLIVCFNYAENKKTPVPAEMKQRIEALEASIR